MNWIHPEPASDICAQALALADPRHPKDALFAAVGNVQDVPVWGAFYHRRPEGVLLTTNVEKLAAFQGEMPDEAGMAAILGYPEPKDAAIAACPSPWLRVVQARGWLGCVITEALCSPGWLDRTVAALTPHGAIHVLTVQEVLLRRFSMRCREAA